MSAATNQPLPKPLRSRLEATVKIACEVVEQGALDELAVADAKAPDKDRSKDMECAPWFERFKGERINDHHLSLAEKRAAREKAARG